MEFHLKPDFFSFGVLESVVESLFDQEDEVMTEFLADVNVIFDVIGIDAAAHATDPTKFAGDTTKKADERFEIVVFWAEHPDCF